MNLLAESDDLLNKADLSGAEEKLLEAISFDQKNCLAFFKLAAVYEEDRKWPEARQTYEYALKLAKQCQKQEEELSDIAIQEIYFCLAFVAKETSDLESALENVREALECEPNNPRYLDLILDLSIMKKDKELAQLSLAKLAEVNPDNQKLSEWQEKVSNL
jgi:tetratricopeptide (TPR) repeat protein